AKPTPTSLKLALQACTRTVRGPQRPGRIAVISRHRRPYNRQGSPDAPVQAPGGERPRRPMRAALDATPRADWPPDPPAVGTRPRRGGAVRTRPAPGPRGGPGLVPAAGGGPAAGRRARRAGQDRPGDPPRPGPGRRAGVVPA